MGRGNSYLLSRSGNKQRTRSGSVVMGGGAGGEDMAQGSGQETAVELGSLGPKTGTVPEEEGKRAAMDGEVPMGQGEDAGSAGDGGREPDAPVGEHGDPSSALSSVIDDMQLNEHELDQVGKISMIQPLPIVLLVCRAVCVVCNP